jgi:hypothetical protein
MIGAQGIDADEDDRALHRSRRAGVPPTANRGERGAERDKRKDDGVSKGPGHNPETISVVP